MRNAVFFFGSAVLGLMSFSVQAEPPAGLQPDLVRAELWNKFAEQVVALNTQRLADRQIKQSEEVERYGGEMGKKYTYREITYVDASSGQLLGRMRWNQKKSDEVQMAEVYVYDEQGRLLRDYAFMYLPWARGAPIRTFVNLHSHENGLHAYRQFDASGTRTYEHCEGEQNGRRVRLSISEERIGGEEVQTEEYRVCFAGLSRTAGALLTPQ